MDLQSNAWKYRWLLVTAGGLVMGAALGVRHVQGLFLQPVTIGHDWSREAFGFALAIQNLVWGLAQPFTGIIADRFGSAKIVLFGAVAYALGLLSMAYAGTPGQFTLGGGVLIGIALSGTGFGAIYGALSRIFPPEHRSWALGVTGAIAGFGQFCMVPFAQGMINGIGWMSALLVLAALMVLMAPLAVFLRDGHSSHASEQQDQSVGSAIREAFRHRGFWLLNAGFLACGFQLAFIGAHLPAYLVDKGMDAKQAGASLAIIALANVVGTYVCGYVGGFMRRKYVLSGIYLVRALAMVLFWMLPLSPLSMYAFCFVFGLIWLGTVPLTSGLVSQIFGVKYISTLFGFVFFGHQLGGFFGVWLGGRVFDATKSYDLLWIGAIALGVISAALHWPINDRKVERPASPALGPLGTAA